jgi:hypothetical protein
MDRFTSMGATLYTMPGFVPGIIGSVIMLLGAVLMLRGWRRGKADGAQPEPDATANEPMREPPHCHHAGAGAGVCRCPAGARTVLAGHRAVRSGLHLAVHAPDDQPTARRTAAAVVAGVVTSAVVTVVFQHVFLVRLP